MTSRGELWLIRHGETEWSRSGQHTSRTDLPLTPEGEQKARAAGRLLHGHKFALVLSSPMQRARETARLAGFEPEVIDDLREWDYGAYEGRTTQEIRKDAPGWTIWTAPPPGGETADQVGSRADRVIARAVSAGGDVAVFGHGHMLMDTCCVCWPRDGWNWSRRRAGCLCWRPDRSVCSDTSGRRG